MSEVVYSSYAVVDISEAGKWNRPYNTVHSPPNCLFFVAEDSKRRQFIVEDNVTVVLEMNGVKRFQAPRISSRRTSSNGHRNAHCIWKNPAFRWRLLKF